MAARGRGVDRTNATSAASCASSSAPSKRRHHAAFFALARMNAVERDLDEIGGRDVGRSMCCARARCRAGRPRDSPRKRCDRSRRHRWPDADRSPHPRCARIAQCRRRRAPPRRHCPWPSGSLAPPSIRDDDVRGDGVDLGGGDAREVVRHRRHRAGGRAVRGVEARAQIRRGLLDRPRRGRRRGFIQRRRAPAFDAAAGEILGRSSRRRTRCAVCGNRRNGRVRRPDSGRGSSAHRARCRERAVRD